MTRPGAVSSISSAIGLGTASLRVRAAGPAAGQQELRSEQPDTRGTTLERPPRIAGILEVGFEADLDAVFGDGRQIAEVIQRRFERDAGCADAR